MLGQVEQRTAKKKIYLSISSGQVVHNVAEGVKDLYSFIEGTVVDIYTKDRPFNGSYNKFWYIDIQDDEEGELYSLCLPYSSGVFKSIVLCLANEEELTKNTIVRIEPYNGGNGFSKVTVFADGVKLDWVTKEMPPIREVMVNGKKLKDETERMQFITDLTEKIKERLQR